MKKISPRMVVSLVFAVAILCGLGSFQFTRAQSALTTFYLEGEAWDCAGVSVSCPKPVAVVDGQNRLFPVRSSPTGAAALDVYLNGLWERPCVAPNVTSCGYTVNVNTAGNITGITMTVAPTGPDQLDLRYRVNFRGNVQAK